jgi:hypothetical protein
MSLLIECEYCFKEFTRPDNLNQHLKNRPVNCLKIEKRFQEMFDKKIKPYVDNAKAKGYLEASQQYENKIGDLQSTQTNIIQEIVNAPSTISRKKKLEDIKSRNKIKNFKTILKTTNFDIKTIRNCCFALADGDIVMFKRSIIDNTPKDEQCIRIKDFARDKYQYFNGSDWVTAPLKSITEMFMDQLYNEYKKVIIEKHKEIDEVDKKYPRRHPKYTDLNNKEFDAITDKYFDASFHYSSLAVYCDKFRTAIMNGIKELLMPTENHN